MNDKNSNSEGTNSEDPSGDSFLQNNPHNGEKNFVPDKGTYGTCESSFNGSAPDS